MNIRLIYLVTGSILVAKMSDPNEEGFHTLEEPRELVPAKSADGKGLALRFMPYGCLMGALPPLTNCTIHAMHLLHDPIEIPKAFEEAYLSAISGIALAR